MPLFRTHRKELFKKSISVNGRRYDVKPQQVTIGGTTKEVGVVDVVEPTDIQKLRRLPQDWTEMSADGAAAPASPGSIPAPAAPQAPAPIVAQPKGADELLALIWKEERVATILAGMEPGKRAETLVSRGFAIPTPDELEAGVTKLVAGKTIREVPLHVWKFIMGRVAKDFLEEYAGESAEDLLSGALEKRVRDRTRRTPAPEPVAAPPPPPPPAAAPPAPAASSPAPESAQDDVTSLLSGSETEDDLEEEPEEPAAPKKAAKAKAAKKEAEKKTKKKR